MTPKQRPKKTRGRPPKYNRPKVIAAICEAIADGGLVKHACARYKISRSVLHSWLSSDKDLLELYMRAREDQAHALAEKAIEISDGDDALTLLREEAIDGYEDELKEADDKHYFKKVSALRAGIINRDRMRVDALKWMASKIAPKNYGDRQEVVGAGGGPIEIKVRFVRDARV